MNANTDYTLNFNRDLSKGNFNHYEQEDPQSTNTILGKKYVEEKKLNSIVNGYLPLSSSRVSSRSQQSEENRQKSEKSSRRHEHLYKEPIHELNQSRLNKKALERGEVYRSYVVYEPAGTYSPSPSNMRSQDIDPKMKTSQATAYTNAVNESHRSRFLDQSQAVFSEVDKNQVLLKEQSPIFEKFLIEDTNKEHEEEKVLKRQSEIMQLLSNYTSPKEQKGESKEVETDMMKLLGRFALSPKTIEESQSGYLLSDPSVERMIGESLANYFNTTKKSSPEPFYENETTIKAEDEAFVFKLSFKFENNNVVFNWQCQKRYPHEDYLSRKYECLNYFVIDVFPDHIMVFNDFTVQPFVYSKSLEKYCVRTQLRSFIPLDDPSKAVTYKHNQSQADSTSIGAQSRYQKNLI